MGLERLSKIMTCERYFNNFRSTFNDDNFVQRTNKINKSSTDSEKEFGKFSTVIYNATLLIWQRNVETYTRNSDFSRDQDGQTFSSIYSPPHDNKTSDSFLNLGGAENMERYLNHFPRYIINTVNQFSWECELEIKKLNLIVSLNGDID